jgi:hypothetical protein
MSEKLYWEPVIHYGTRVGEGDLKFILQSCSGLPRIMSSKDLDYLCGLRDARVSGAAELIKAIEGNSEIRVYLSN